MEENRNILIRPKFWLILLAVAFMSWRFIFSAAISDVRLSEFWVFVPDNLRTPESLAFMFPLAHLFVPLAFLIISFVVSGRAKPIRLSPFAGVFISSFVPAVLWTVYYMNGEQIAEMQYGHYELDLSRFSWQAQLLYKVAIFTSMLFLLVFLWMIARGDEAKIRKFPEIFKQPKFWVAAVFSFIYAYFSCFGYIRESTLDSIIVIPAVAIWFFPALGYVVSNMKNKFTVLRVVWMGALYAILTGLYFIVWTILYDGQTRTALYWEYFCMFVIIPIVLLVQVWMLARPEEFKSNRVSTLETKIMAKFNEKSPRKLLIAGIICAVVGVPLIYIRIEWMPYLGAIGMATFFVGVGLIVASFGVRHYLKAIQQLQNISP
jgi:hypothetical protein